MKNTAKEIRLAAPKGSFTCKTVTEENTFKTYSVVEFENGVTFTPENYKLDNLINKLRRMGYIQRTGGYENTDECKGLCLANENKLEIFKTTELTS